MKEYAVGDKCKNKHLRFCVCVCVCVCVNEKGEKGERAGEWERDRQNNFYKMLYMTDQSAQVALDSTQNQLHSASSVFF